MMLWRSLRPREIVTALLALERVLRSRSRAEWIAPAVSDRDLGGLREQDRWRLIAATDEIKERI